MLLMQRLHTAKFKSALILTSSARLEVNIQLNAEELEEFLGAATSSGTAVPKG